MHYLIAVNQVSEDSVKVAPVFRQYVEYGDLTLRRCFAVLRDFLRKRFKLVRITNIGVDHPGFFHGKIVIYTRATRQYRCQNNQSKDCWRNLCNTVYFPSLNHVVILKFLVMLQLLIVRGPGPGPGLGPLPISPNSKLAKPVLLQNIRHPDRVYIALQPL